MHKRDNPRVPVLDLTRHLKRHGKQLRHTEINLERPGWSFGENE